MSMPSPSEIARQDEWDEESRKETKIKNNRDAAILCAVKEAEGEGDWGDHRFLIVPRKGEVISIRYPDIVARVRDVMHFSTDFQDGVSAILYVIPL
jgi:hypothetical protein